MEAGNGMPGEMLPASSWPPTGHGHPQQQQQLLLNHHHHLGPFSAPDATHRSQLQQQQQQQIPHPYSTYLVNKGKHPSPEEEPVGDGTGDATKGAAAPSPWHRMKWTDDMVRLLIKIVYCMGDDGAGAITNDGGDVPPASKGKKAAAALQQKKGKWKSVSRAMMENGFYVSPQQCEDKFNDLNKRYKRVNELLGKGNGCRVVENQALLDTMTHLTPKAKEEARKLLNSKHLFFREMCAYHNGGGAANASSCSAVAAEVLAAPSPPPPPAAQCFHPSPETADDDAESDDDKDDDYGDVEEDDNGSACSKRPRGAVGQSPPLALSLWSEPEAATATEVQQLRKELDGARGQQTQWLRRKTEELEEQRVGYQCQALRYERERFRWLRYCRNKEREIEERMLNNQRLRLYDEQMLLLLRKKELELDSAVRGGGSRSSLSVQPSTTMDRSAAGLAGLFDVQ